jgi:hypothetical protein
MDQSEVIGTSTAIVFHGDFDRWFFANHSLLSFYAELVFP